MRGQLDLQSSMFHYFSPESRVPADHPLRRVKRLADRAPGHDLRRIGPVEGTVLMSYPTDLGCEPGLFLVAHCRDLATQWLHVPEKKNARPEGLA